MRVFPGAAIALALISASAQAGVVSNYDEWLFYQLQVRGEPVLLFVTDDSCEPCATEELSIRKLVAGGKYSKVNVLKIDGRKQSRTARALGAKERPTLIGFSGFTETGRISNASDTSRVSALLESTLH